MQRCLDMSKIMEMLAGAQDQDLSWLLRSGSWTMDRTVDCSCETPSRLRGSSFFTLPTAHWQPATAHSPPATDNPCRGPSGSCVHWWTSAGKRPQKSHLVSRFGPPGVPFRRQSAIHKSFCGRRIELETRPPRASKTPCGTENPKVSYRFPLIVHYLQPWVEGREPWKNRAVASLVPKAADGVPRDACPSPCSPSRNDPVTAVPPSDKLEKPFPARSQERYSWSLHERDKASLPGHTPRSDSPSVR